MAASKTLLIAKPTAGASHAPAELGGDTATASVYSGSPRRLVADVLADKTTTVKLYRYSRALEEWVLLADSAQNTSANAAVETRWQTNGIDGYYCMVLTDNTATGTWQPIPALQGP